MLTKKMDLHLQRMKNKLLYLGIGALTIAMASCSNDYLESLSTSTAKQKGLITATVENNGAATRVGFDSDGKFYWTAGDEIGVLDSQYSFAKMTLVEGGEGTQEGSFTTDEDITIDENYGCAVYPYFKDDVNIHECQPAYNRLNYYLRPTYTYNGLDTDFFTGDKDKKQSFNVPLFGKITKDDDGNRSVTFKHIGGVICVKIPNIPISEGYFILSSEVTGANAMSIGDGYITGIFQTSMDDNAQIKTSNAYGKGNGNTVTIHFTDATPGQSGVFYVPVPTGTYDITVKLVDNAVSPTSTYAIEQRSDVVVTKGMLYGINVKNTSVSSSGNARLELTVSSVEEANKALAMEDNVKVILESVSGTDNNIKIPAVKSSTAEKVLEVSEIEYGTVLNISDESGDDTSLGLLWVHLASAQNLESTINMPNSKVYIDSNNGIAQFNKVTAITAENTFEISSGITINSLYASGNVIVYNGGVVGSVSKYDYQNDNTPVFIINYGGTVDSFGDYAYNVEEISTPEGLKFAMTYNDVLPSLKLTSNIDVTESIEFTNTKQLNLNGYNITVHKYNDDYVEQRISIIDMADIILEGESGGIYVDEVRYGVFVNGGHLTINGGITIQGNTSCVMTGKKGGVVEINGGEYKLKDADSYDKLLSGDFTITGGTFYGFDPSSNNNEDAHIYIPSGYESKKTGTYYDGENTMDVYTVSPTSSSDDGN